MIALNKKRKFGSSNLYHAVVLDVKGIPTPALFTPGQVEVAVRRAEEQPEDAPRLSWWQKIRREIG